MRRLTWVLVATAGCGGFSAGGGFDTDTDTDGGDTGETDVAGDSGDGGGGGGGNGDSGPGPKPPVVPDGVPFITEVVDGPNERWVEIHNPTNVIADLKGEDYRIVVIPNGDKTKPKGTQLDAVPTILDVPPSGFIVVCMQGTEAAFETRYGRPCTIVSPTLCDDPGGGDPCGDGDDAYLWQVGARPNDWFGTRNEDGSGTAWEYTNKAAKRKADVTKPSTPGSASGGAEPYTFQPDEWEIVDNSEARPFRRD